MGPADDRRGQWRQMMAGATAFGHELKKAFAAQSSTASFGEIAQFRALMAAFSSLRPRFPVEELHGSRHQIYFHTSRPWLRRLARCELCDLLIVSYSTAGGLNARMTLLQAKLSHAAYPNIGKAGASGVDHLQFRANFEQWDLLASRPVLIPTTVFAPPPNLLKDALVPSVGSFGVFHQVAGTVEFFYVSADCLIPTGAPIRASGKLETQAAMPRWRTGAGYSDITCCDSVGDFGCSLYGLEIGTPVAWTTAKGIQAYSEPAAGWLRRVLTSYVQLQDRQSDLVSEFLGGLPPNFRVGIDRLGDPREPLPNIPLVRGERRLRG